MTSLRTALFVSAALIAVPAAAQDSSAPAGEAQPGSDDFHDTIVVTAAGLDRLDLLAGTSVIEGAELQRNLDGQIGEVLADLPGVSASGFSPGASRPILRGFGGDRVRVLTDGVGVIDASAASDDHAVSVDPLIASRVEVLRGPAVLLYGSQAIGGAVNVITKRIPPAPLEEAVHVDALAAGDTASNRREGGLSADFRLEENIVFHVDGSYRKTDDLEIPGFVATRALREDLLADAAEEEEEGHLEEAEELREGAQTRGFLPNSGTETYSVGTGIGLFSGRSSFGVSFDYYDTEYGIPGLPGVGHVHGGEEEEHDDHDEHDGHDDHDEDHDHDHEEHDEEGHEHGEEDVSIGLKRYRFDVRGNIALGDGFFDRIEARLGYSDYTHTEFEGDEIGTVFDVEGVEGRVEMVQTRKNNWGGSVGLQYSDVDFAAIGAEAYIPSNNTRNIALFTVQDFDFDRLGFQVGGRYENTSVDASDSVGIEREFDSLSASAGLSYGLIGDSLDALRVGVIASRAERAPSAQELFADGPHLATQQFEVGNSALSTETAWGLEGYLRGAIGAARLSASIYQSWFDGFIFLSETGAIEDGLEVFEYLQQDATQFGIEGQVAMPVYQSDAFSLLADLRADYVRASLDDGSPLPRIPPLSLQGALEGQFGHFDARAEVQYYAEQDRVSEHESPTDSFTFVNASLAWHPLEGNDNVTVLLQADNIFDVEGRRHASFTKEFVPLAGRNFRISARASF